MVSVMIGWPSVSPSASTKFLLELLPRNEADRTAQAAVPFALKTPRSVGRWMSLFFEGRSGTIVKGGINRQADAAGVDIEARDTLAVRFADSLAHLAFGHDRLEHRREAIDIHGLLDK
jgi:hypothetical protein